MSHAAALVCLRVWANKQTNNKILLDWTQQGLWGPVTTVHKGPPSPPHPPTASSVALCTPRPTPTGGGRRVGSSGRGHQGELGAEDAGPGQTQNGQRDRQWLKMVLLQVHSKGQKQEPLWLSSRCL